MSKPRFTDCATMMLAYFFCISCTSLPLEALGASSGKYSLPQMDNRATMPFEIDGQKFEGIAVVDRKTSMKFVFQPPKGTLQFTITTCNGEEYFPRPEDGKQIAWTFEPVQYVENLRSCLLMATAITSQGETYTGLVEFRQGKDEVLPATSKCNRRATKRIGAELCQSRAGLVQVIEFDAEVVYSDLMPGCAELQPAYGQNSFQYRISDGICIYKFMDKNKRTFRLTTFGYSTIKDALK